MPIMKDFSKPRFLSTSRMPSSTRFQNSRLAGVPHFGLVAIESFPLAGSLTVKGVPFTSL